jgi:hypothetical protein
LTSTPLNNLRLSWPPFAAIFIVVLSSAVIFALKYFKLSISYETNIIAPDVPLKYPNVLSDVLYISEYSTGVIFPSSV